MFLNRKNSIQLYSAVVLGIINEWSLNNTRLVRVAVKPDRFKREDFSYRVSRTEYIHKFLHTCIHPQKCSHYSIFNPQYGYLVNTEKEL